MNDVLRLLTALHEARVKFVVIGGVAATVHGSAYVTYHLDICYDRNRANLKLLAAALEQFHPRLREAPRNLPFRLDAETLWRGMNFTLATDSGDLDLQGELEGIGSFEQALALSEKVRLFQITCAVPSIEGLIATKRAASRAKDLLVLPELEALRELRSKRPQPLPSAKPRKNKSPRKSGKKRLRHGEH
jgi:hypothetical protein